ncbi:hypothetical protein V8C86DRAFT_3109683 [Haematococcus lacustris]
MSTPAHCSPLLLPGVELDGPLGKGGQLALPGVQAKVRRLDRRGAPATGPRAEVFCNSASHRRAVPQQLAAAQRTRPCHLLSAPVGVASIAATTSAATREVEMLLIVPRSRRRILRVLVLVLRSKRCLKLQANRGC